MALAAAITQVGAGVATKKQEAPKVPSELLQQQAARWSAALNHRPRPELVVQADPEDVVGNARVEAGSDEAAAKRDDRGDERTRREAAEVYVKVLDLAGPVAAETAFEADAD